MATIQTGVKREILQHLESRKKTIEIRGNSPNFKDAVPSDHLIFNTRIRCIILRVTLYDSFEKLVAAEDPEKILPGATREEILEACHQYMAGGDRRGALAIEFFYE
jgi:ASC-1-like (ASCH) protein